MRCRLDAEKKHHIVCAAFQKSSEEVGKIQGLLDSLVQQSDLSKLGCLQSFLDDFREADSIPRLEERNFEWILKALEFEGMEARREKVESTVGNTFEWIIANNAVPENHSDMKISFKEWLSDGTGVFHVMGRPGIGKSTLMKLIDQSAVTRKQLESWASQTGERLIIARFYTWKAANAHPFQNQEEGMARTLLHQVLAAAPELTRVVFAQHPCWNPQRYHLINLLSWSQSLSARIHFQPKEIFTALESLFRFQGYRYFLLIDGMDEIEKPHNHRAIADRVLQWSSQNLERVKICVSSREDNAFMDIFPADQRLRLHIVTANDVLELVEKRLMEHDYFAQAPEEDRRHLVRKVVLSAEGVFLCVILTIQELKLLMDDRQNFKTLLRAVEGFPKEMEDFMFEILSRIPESYKKELDAILTVATSKFNVGPVLCLLHYSMLRKCVELGEAGVDDPPCEITLDKAAMHVQEFRSRFPSLCKGLLDITPVRIPRSFPKALGGRKTIQVTHRSVLDCLGSIKQRLGVENTVLPPSSQPGVLAIRSAIEVIKAIPWYETTSKANEGFVVGIVRRIRYDKDLHTHSIFSSLRALDSILLRRLGAIPAATSFESMALADISPHALAISVIFTAFQADCYPYIDWALRNYPAWILTLEAKAFFVETLLFEVFELKAQRSRQLFRIGGQAMPIQCLTKSGWLLINEPIMADWSLIPRFSPILRVSVWVNILVCLMANPWAISKVDLVSLLSAGAEPRIRFKWWIDPVSRESDASDVKNSWRPWVEHDARMPPRSQFGMTMEVGDSNEPLRIQGPQWRSKDDLRLFWFCVDNFGKLSGSATLRDILEVLLKLHLSRLDTSHRRRQRARKTFEEEKEIPRLCLQAVDEALARVDELSTIDTQSNSGAMRDATEDGQRPDTGGTTESVQKGAQQAAVPHDDKPFQLLCLGSTKHFNDWKTFMISSLSKLCSCPPWLPPSALSFWGTDNYEVILLAILCTFGFPQPWWE